MNNIRKYNLNDITRLCNLHLDLFEKLQLIEDLFSELGYITITDYVSKTGEKDKNIRNRIKAGKLPNVILGSSVFIVQKML